MYTVSKIIPPIKKEALHYETADFRIFGTVGPFLLFGFSFPSWANYYKVKQGDTLSSISKKFNVSIQEIKRTNHLRQSVLKANQVIRIGKKSSGQVAEGKKVRTSYYVVQKGDTLSRIAMKTHVPLKKLTALNRVRSRSLRVGQRIHLASAKPALKDGIAKRERDAHEEDEETDEDSGEDSLANDAYFSALTEERSLPDKQEYLGKWNSPDEVQTLIKVATEFLGAPYRFGGSSLYGKGIDCSAFVQKIYRMFNVELPRSAREQAKIGIKISKDDLTEGDLVFFNTYRSFGHVGIYIGNNEFVHASTRGKIVRIDRMDTPFYKKRFQRAVRVKDWENEGT